MNISSSSTVFKEDLGSLFRAGNKEAFGKFYDQYSPMLFGLICVIIKNDDLARKTLADSLMYIWKNRLVYAGKQENASLWILKQTRNIALNAATESIELPADNSFGQDKVKQPILNDNQILLRAEDDDRGNDIFKYMYVYAMSGKQVCSLLGLPQEIITEKLKCAFNKLKGQDQK